MSSEGITSMAGGNKIVRISGYLYPVCLAATHSCSWKRYIVQDITSLYSIIFTLDIPLWLYILHGGSTRHQHGCL
jgi:hypothetical protein